jgi:DNA-directed RNA polymerase specialized sigma24 family protein
VRTIPRSDPASLAAGVAGAIVTRRSRRPNDERLAALHARVLQGDREAADEIALLLLPDVRRGVRSAAPREDPHAIDTVVDDAVMVHLREPAAFDPARASLVSWLVAIALNKLKGLQRSRRRRLAHEQPEGVDFSQKPVSVSADDDAAARERKMARWAAALRAAVRTPRERALVEARLAGAGFDAQATAYGIEGLPKAKARVVLYRAWENLVRRARRILKREDADAG